MPLLLLDKCAVEKSGENLGEEIFTPPPFTSGVAGRRPRRRALAEARSLATSALPPEEMEMQFARHSLGCSYFSASSVLGSVIELADIPVKTERDVRTSWRLFRSGPRRPLSTGRKGRRNTTRWRRRRNERRPSLSWLRAGILPSSAPRNPKSA